MPNLVQGHLRFTEEDYVYTDFYEKIKNDVNNKSVHQLFDEYRTVNNGLEQNDFKKAFIAFSRLAYANGYTINDLMK
jgi:hypothetical protein